MVNGFVLWEHLGRYVGQPIRIVELEDAVLGAGHRLHALWRNYVDNDPQDFTLDARRALNKNRCLTFYMQQKGLLIGDLFYGFCTKLPDFIFGFFGFFNLFIQPRGHAPQNRLRVLFPVGYFL